MGALSFADDVVVDPTQVVALYLPGWVDQLARRSRATARAYVSDVAIVAEGIAAARHPEAPLGDLDSVEVPARALEVVPEVNYRRAAVALGAVTLADLHPRVLGEVIDALAVGRSAASTRRLLSGWSSLCELLVRRGVLASNPARDGFVDVPRQPAPNPHPLDSGDASAILAVLGQHDPGARWPWPARDVALAAMLLTTGLRVSEVAEALVTDVRVGDSPRVRVVGKGAKPRTVPLHSATIDALGLYLRERKERGFDEDGGTARLFVRGDGTPLSTRAVRRLVERWFTRAGVRKPEGASVHALRHTFATDLLDSGSSVVEVQSLLGHASLKTTSVYLSVVGSGLSDAIAGHPAGRLVEKSLHDQK